MRAPYNGKPLPVPLRDHDRRRHGRLRTSDMDCSLGEVLDLSASGARTCQRTARPCSAEGEVTEVVLRCAGIELPLQARVIRVEKLGFRCWSYGIEFLGLSDRQRAQLTALVRIGSERLVML